MEMCAALKGFVRLYASAGDRCNDSSSVSGGMDALTVELRNLCLFSRVVCCERYLCAVFQSILSYY